MASPEEEAWGEGRQKAARLGYAHASTITLREHAAVALLAGMAGPAYRLGHEMNCRVEPLPLAREAVRLADALLTALSEPAGLAEHP